MDRTQNSNNTTMQALKRALPKDEELRFRHAVQCTTCLNPDHSTLEYTMRTNSSLCHSRAHIIDQGEYNMLNRLAALIQQIEPRDEQRPEEDRFRSGLNGSDQKTCIDRRNTKEDGMIQMAPRTTIGNDKKNVKVLVCRDS